VFIDLVRQPFCYLQRQQICSYCTKKRMSLPQLLAGLVDQHGETIQQAALLAYLRQGEEAQPALEVGTTEYTE
jgi:hypothetical protein